MSVSVPKAIEVPDEKAEQLICYTILAHMAAESQELSKTKTYLAHAFHLLQDMSNKPVYRSPIISRFAQLSIMEGEKALFPFVGNQLIIPILNILEFSEKKQVYSRSAITLKDFCIVYYKLTFKPAEFLECIHSAHASEDVNMVASSLSALLERIFKHPLSLPEPFDLARDNFMLAGTIITDSPALASFALQHADHALQTIKQDSDCNDGILQMIGSMQQQIESLQSGIQRINIRLGGAKH